jgi:hypothetical protein
MGVTLGAHTKGRPQTVYENRGLRLFGHKREELWEGGEELRDNLEEVSVDGKIILERKRKR